MQGQQWLTLELCSAQPAPLNTAALAGERKPQRRMNRAFTKDVKQQVLFWGVEKPRLQITS